MSGLQNCILPHHGAGLRHSTQRGTLVTCQVSLTAAVSLNTGDLWLWTFPGQGCSLTPVPKLRIGVSNFL